jgi:hypothetical protein
VSEVEGTAIDGTVPTATLITLLDVTGVFSFNVRQAGTGSFHPLKSSAFHGALLRQLPDSVARRPLAEVHSRLAFRGTQGDWLSKAVDDGPARIEDLIAKSLVCRFEVKVLFLKNLAIPKQTFRAEWQAPYLA